MVEKGGVEWAHFALNPWVGHSKLSPACDYCCAEGWVKRAGESLEWRSIWEHPPLDFSLPKKRPQNILVQALHDIVKHPPKTCTDESAAATNEDWRRHCREMQRIARVTLKKMGVKNV